MEYSPPLFMTGSYRDILKREFASRAGRNPQYSLRAFARDLDFLPSRLSDVLNGKHGLSRRSASGIAERLGYAPSQRQYFCTLVEAEHARSQARKEQAREELLKLERPQDYRNLEEATFNTIADWYHFAILELFGTQRFIEDKHWIARRLGITPIEAELAIERLSQLGMLIKKNGRHRVAVEYPSTMSEVPSAAIRKHHTQMMEKAARALQEQPVESRDFSSLTLAMDPSLLPMVKEEIKNFRRELEKKIKKATKNKRSVYCLSVQFFDLCTPRREN